MWIKEMYNKIDKETKYGLLLGVVIALAVMLASINF